MARDSFTTAIGQGWSGAGSSGTSPDGRYAQELISGVKRPKPSGWIPPTSYGFTRTAWKRDYGDVSIGGTKISGCVGGCPLIGYNSRNNWDDAYMVGSVPLSLRDEALVKARLKMKSQTVNLGVAFAERSKTASMIGSSARTMAYSVMALKRGNFRHAASILGIYNPRRPRGSSVPKWWLQLQYGWKPLLSDIYGSVEALTSRDNHDWIVTGKGRSSIKTAFNKNVGSGWSAATVEGEVEMGYNVRIDAIPGNPLLGSFRSLGITNPLEVIWEVVPFSFVLDWLLPVGNYLSSLDAMLGYEQSWTAITEYQRVNWRSRGRSSDGFIHNNSGEKQFVQVNRTAVDSVPLPTMPRLKDPRSFGHMANGLSLLAQAFGRR